MPLLAALLGVRLGRPPLWSGSLLVWDFCCLPRTQSLEAVHGTQNLEAVHGTVIINSLAAVPSDAG